MEFKDVRTISISPIQKHIARQDIYKIISILYKTHRRLNKNGKFDYICGIAPSDGSN